MQASRLPLQRQLTGGACARMLRCKTDSANVIAPGGPVSNANVSMVTCGGGGKISAAWSCLPTNCIATVATLFTTGDATARKSLQQGTCVADFCFAGAECIGHWPASATESGGGAFKPSAQWFDRQTQAAIMRSTVILRMVVPIELLFHF